MMATALRGNALSALGAALALLVGSKLLRTALTHSSILVFFLLVLVYIFYEIYWKRRKLPNGPLPWLVAGNMASFASGIQIDDLLQSWRRRFGGVFTVWIGPIPLVMVCDLPSIKKYFVQNADVFSNRWRNHVTDTFMGGVNGVVQIDGEKWREQRRFSLHVLRDFGVGRALMEEKIMHEVGAFCTYLAEHDGPVKMHDPVAVCVGNIINSMLFGFRYPQGSPEMKCLHELLDAQSHLVMHPLMGLYIAAPFTTTIPLINYKWKRLLELRTSLWAFLQIQVEEHKRRFDEGYRGEDDFTFTYLMEMEKRRIQGEDMGFFDEWQMTMLLLDLFFAGMETTVTTLKWGFLLTTLHPEIQAKIQEELDLNCTGEFVTLADRPNLPYTQATINEIQRMANILPINLPRTTAEDVEIDGYVYPKGTFVVPQISVLMQDEAFFPSPKSFKPERFLTEEGRLLRIDEFIPFSIGKRQCLGESLARAELFLVYANALKRFNFAPPEGCTLSTKRILGLTVSPPEYECIVTPRKVDLNCNEL